MRWTDHKTVGLQYGVTGLCFLLVGFLLMILMRWQLAWPGPLDRARWASRIQAVRRYWLFVDAVWLVIVVSFYLV